MKDKLDQLKKSTQELCDRATRAAETVKQAAKVGVDTGRAAIERAGKVVNRDKIGQGLEATSRGVEAVAKGAKVASMKVAERVERIAKQVEKASTKLKQLGDKVRGQGQGPKGT
jgi:hypothetical protein